MNSEEKQSGGLISLGSQLKNCPGVLTIGLRSSLLNYTSEELNIIRNARVVLFPSLRFIDVLRSAGKAIYPSYSSYVIGNSILKQAVFFKLAGIPHPRTIICMSRDGIGKVLENFSYPFLGIDYKTKNRFKIRHPITCLDDLIRYLRNHKLCVFTELIRDQNVVKVVVIDSEVVFSYRCRKEYCEACDAPRKVVSIPAGVLRIVEGILSCSELNHFVAEIAEDENGGHHVCLKVNYILPVEEMLSLGFDPYGWLCERICTGNFSYMKDWRIK